MMDSSKQDKFISLQDICKLKILLNIELFPLKTLAQLPRSIRRHIFRILPVFDRLYYEQDYDDFQRDFLIDLEVEDICPDNQKLNGNSTNTMKKALTDCLFKLSKQALVEGCRVNLEEASHFLDCLSSEDQPFIQYVFDYMNRCCSCEVLSWPNDSHSSGCLGNESSTQKPFNNYLVIPSRFINGFLAVKKPTQSWERPSDFEIVIHNLQAFVSYCNLQGQSGGKRLSIDTISLLGSPLWGEYSSIKEKAIEKHKSSHPPEPSRQPMICEQDYPGASSSAAQPHQLISSLPMSSAMPVAPLLTSLSGMAPVQPPTSTFFGNQFLSSLPLGYTPLSETLTVTSSLSSTPVPEQLFPSIVQLQPLVSPSYHSVPIIDPTCYFFQDMLSSVEHLVIGTNEQFEPSCYDEEELSVDAPSFIMHNIVQSHLKSIHIHGICSTVTDTIDTVTAFLCGQDNGPAAGIMKNRYDQRGNEYSIKPSGKPCFIENLKITAESGDYDYVRQYMLECDSASISYDVKEIIKSQKSTLKSISLSSLGFTYNELETSNERLDTSSLGPDDLEIVNSKEYCSLLQTSLVDFIQFPQFESLNLGESPDRVCYPLVMAFLTTPASHEQKLSISLRPQEPVVKDWYKECTIPANIPSESNLKFKFLNLKGEESQVIKHILSFPSLSLKSFRLSTHHLSARDTVPSAINIQCFTLLVEDEKLSDVKLRSFICGNPSLRTLTISQCGYHQFRSLLSIINKCLVRLVENQATLESIILDGVDLSHYLHLKPMVSHQLQQAPQHVVTYSDNVVQQKPSTSRVDSKGYNFTKWLNPTVTNIVTECKSAISPHKTMHDGNNSPPTSGSPLMSGGITSVTHGLPMSQSIGGGIIGTGFSPSGGLSLNYSATPLIGGNIGVTPSDGSSTSTGSFIQPHPSFSIHTPPTVSMGDGINTFVSQLMDDINVHATVYEGNDLFMFFFLLQKLDAALTLTGSNLYLDRKCEKFQKNLVPLLEEANVKIRKITLKNNYRCFKDVFSTVASTVNHI